jgi:hypothetical protein
MKTKLLLNENQTGLLKSVLRSHRASLIKQLEETSPIKNWLAYKMCAQDLEEIEGALDQINEPITVFY